MNEADNDPKQSTGNEEFQRRLVETLDQSLDDFDQSTVDQLDGQRRLALDHKPRALTWPRRQPLWAASAAAVLLIAALPWFFSAKQETSTPLPQASSPIDAEYYSVDPEMLEVMDMLMAWGELAEEAPDEF